MRVCSDVSHTSNLPDHKHTTRCFILSRHHHGGRRWVCVSGGGGGWGGGSVWPELRRNERCFSHAFSSHGCAARQIFSCGVLRACVEDCGEQVCGESDCARRVARSLRAESPHSPPLCGVPGSAPTCILSSHVVLWLCGGLAPGPHLPQAALRRGAHHHFTLHTQCVCNTRVVLRKSRTHDDVEEAR